MAYRQCTRLSPPVADPGGFLWLQWKPPFWTVPRALEPYLFASIPRAPVVSRNIGKRGLGITHVDYDGVFDACFSTLLTVCLMHALAEARSASVPLEKAFARV